MILLTDAMKETVERARLCYVATVTPDGRPNLSPKGSLIVLNEILVFADLASPCTIANLRANPAIEINVVDPFSRKGFRFKGSAEVISEGTIYSSVKARLQERHGPSLVVDHVVTVNVLEAAPLISPAYALSPGISEAQVREEWQNIYGLRPRAEPPPAPTVEAFRAEFTLARTVEFHETDMAGVVHFANFFTYFEMTEAAFFRSIGSNIFDVATNLRWPRVHSSCDYKAPLRFGDAIEIQLGVKNVNERSVGFEFLAAKKEGGALIAAALGRSIVVCAYFDDREHKIRSQSIPEQIAKFLKDALARRS